MGLELGWKPAAPSTTPSTALRILPQNGLPSQ
jgi:hypothetical protein